MDIAKVPIGRDAPHDINVVVEIPQGGAPFNTSSTNVRERSSSTAFYTPRCFIRRIMNSYPHLGSGWRPDRCLCGRPAPVVPGAVIRCRPIGALMMEDKQGPDEKIVASPSTRCIRFTPTCTRTRVRPRSCPSRSPISFAITKASREASGPDGALGGCRRSGRPHRRRNRSRQGLKPQES